MPTLIMTKGLPASGKSTWAKEQVDKGNGKVKRINKDDLRAMIDNSKWSRQNESQILKARDSLLCHFLGEEFDVIVDDTNLDPKHEDSLRHTADIFGADFEIKDFTDVPLQTCIDRDSARQYSVGKKVIKSMYNKYLHPKGNVAKYEPPVWNPDLPFCIIVDIDGTIAHSTGRNMYDRSRVHEDAPDEIVVELVKKYAEQTSIDGMKDYYVVIVSGRDAVCMPETTIWLTEHNIPYDELHMRPEGDERKDSIVKQEIYEKYIKDRYNVRFVLDDRNQVVNMWRGLGLKVLQVAEGDF